MSGRVTVGHAIAGRFAVSRLIGGGPMGEVVEVKDQGSGVAYACKLLHPGVGQSGAWPVFADEARRASALGPGVARVLETGFDPQAQAPFVLEELVASPSVAARAAHGPLPPDLVVRLVRSLVAPLAAAHSAGIAHRDLVPTNVFVDDAGGVRITDFGMAALRAAVPPLNGAFPLGWVPPEQVQGAPPAPTMDVYGVGLLAFFALTGRAPFLALAQPQPDAAALWTEMTSPLPTMSERARQLGGAAPAALDAWFARALAVDPARRFPSVREMADAMEAALPAAPVAPVAPRLAAKGTMMMGPNAADVMAEVERRKQAQALGNAPTQAFATPPPMMTPFAGGPPPAAQNYATPPPAMAPAQPSLPGDDEIPGVPSKKKNTGLIVAGVLVAVVTLGLGATLVIVFGKKKDEPPADSPATTASSTPEPAASGSAAPDSAPAASGSAAPSGDAPGTDSLVTVKCDPDCDEVKCDGKKIDPAAGVRLKPGKHVCVGTKTGFLPASDKFATKAGEDAPRALTLKPAPVGKPAGAKKCKGTFLNCPLTDQHQDRRLGSVELLQLAVFAASAIVQALVRVEPVRLGLAWDAPLDARQRSAPCFRDGLAALFTGQRALSLREPTPRPFDRAVDRCVDLILHRAVLCPTGRHRRSLGRARTMSRLVRPTFTSLGRRSVVLGDLCLGAIARALHRPSRRVSQLARRSPEARQPGARRRAGARDVEHLGVDSLARFALFHRRLEARLRPHRGGTMENRHLQVHIGLAVLPGDDTALLEAADERRIFAVVGDDRPDDGNRRVHQHHRPARLDRRAGDLDGVVRIAAIGETLRLFVVGACGGLRHGDGDHRGRHEDASASARPS